MKKNENADLNDVLELIVSVKEAELDIVKKLFDLSGQAETKEESDDKEEKKDKKTESGKQQQDAKEEDYENMMSKDLYALCCKRGLSSKCKSRKKADLIKVLREGTQEEDNVEEEEDWDEEDFGDDKYGSLTDIELYKECKKRGLSVKKRMSREEYIKILKDDDAAESDTDNEEDDDEDWTI